MRKLVVYAITCSLIGRPYLKLNLISGFSHLHGSNPMSDAIQGYLPKERLHARFMRGFIPTDRWTGCRWQANSDWCIQPPIPQNIQQRWRITSYSRTRWYLYVSHNKDIIVFLFFGRLRTDCMHFISFLSILFYITAMRCPPRMWMIRTMW